MSKQTKILVVDDNEVNLKLVSDLLSMEGFEVIKCFNAEEALILLQGNYPSLILMDVALPGIDGLTLTRKLKADQKTREIKIVAVTAFAMKSDEEKIRAAGCDGFITKPLNTRTFLNQLRPYLK